MTPIIDSVRTFILKFPQLKEGCLLVDGLGAEAIEYAVETVPCSPVYKQYTDGGSIRQFLFLFASRELYSEDVNQCIENMAFYEEFERWIEAQSRCGNLPELDGRRALDLSVLTGGYAFDTDTGTARYQVQLRLLYEDI
jgi:hypothetical protein